MLFDPSNLRNKLSIATLQISKNFSRQFPFQELKHFLNLHNNNMSNARPGIDHTDQLFSRIKHTTLFSALPSFHH